jgi:hypothetical protein
LMFLLATFPKVAKKKKKALTQSSKSSFPISPKSQDQWNTQQERHTKERYSQRERDRDRERERLRNSHTQNWLLLSCNKI